MMGKIKKRVNKSFLGPIIKPIYIYMLDKKRKNRFEQSKKEEKAYFHQEIRNISAKSPPNGVKFKNIQEAKYIIFVGQVESIDILLQMLSTILRFEDSSELGVIVCGANLEQANEEYNAKVLSRDVDITVLKQFFNSLNAQYVSYFDKECIPLGRFVDKSKRFIDQGENIYAVSGKFLNLDEEIVTTGIQIIDSSIDSRGVGKSRYDLSESYKRFSHILPNDFFSCSFELFGSSISRIDHFKNLNLSVSVEGMRRRSSAVYLPDFEFLKMPTNGPENFDSNAAPAFLEILESEECEKIALIFSIKEYEKHMFNADVDKVRKVVYIDADIPRMNNDAGSDLNIELLKILVNMKCNIIYIAAFPNQINRHNLLWLHENGIQVMTSGNLSALQINLSKVMNNEVNIIVNRVTVARHVIPVVKEKWPDANIIFSVQDLHYLREIRKAKLNLDLNGFSEALELMSTELSLVDLATATLVVSVKEKEILNKFLPRSNVLHIPLIYSANVNQRKKHKIPQIIFVGGFNHRPNVEAVLNLKENIWPKVRQQNAHCVIRIIGSNPTREILELNDENDGFHVLGYVENIAEHYKQSSLFVAPLTFGAGVKGKVIQALSYGIPGVISSVAAEGTHLINGDCVFITDEPKDFALQILRLCSDDNLNQTMGDAAINFVKQYHSSSIAQSTLKGLIR